jgi:hypothetical protein
MTIISVLRFFNDSELELTKEEWNLEQWKD